MDDIKSRIRRCLETAFCQYNFLVFDFDMREVPPVISSDMRDFWGGYEIEFRIIDTANYERLKDRPEALRRQAI